MHERTIRLLGEWDQVDPLGQYHSPFVYSSNNPINYFDPTGLWSFDNYSNQDFATKYVDPDGNLLAETNDGNDASVIIPNDKIEQFLADFNNTSVLFRDGSDKNAEWIRTYGAGMYAEEGGTVQEWATAAIAASTVALTAEILKKSIGLWYFRLNKGLNLRFYIKNWANQYGHALSVGKFLEYTSFIAGTYGGIVSTYDLLSGETSGLKGWFEVGLNWGSLATGPYGAAALLGYEVGKMHPLRLIGIDATKWFKK